MCHLVASIRSRERRMAPLLNYDTFLYQWSKNVKIIGGGGGGGGNEKNQLKGNPEYSRFKEGLQGRLRYPWRETDNIPEWIREIVWMLRGKHKE